jgi:hypothetical protein
MGLTESTIFTDDYHSLVKSGENYFWITKSKNFDIIAKIPVDVEINNINDKNKKGIILIHDSCMNIVYQTAGPVELNSFKIYKKKQYFFSSKNAITYRINIGGTMLNNTTKIYHLFPEFYDISSNAPNYYNPVNEMKL